MPFVGLDFNFIKDTKDFTTSIHGTLGSEVGEEEAEPTTTSTGLARERRLLLNHHHLWTPFSLDLHYLFLLMTSSNPFPPSLLAPSGG